MAGLRPLSHTFGRLASAGIALALVVVQPHGSADAFGPLNPVSGNQGFGIVVHGNATLTSTETEATVAIGGNLTLGGSYNVALNNPGTFVVPGDARPTALVVGGQVNFAASAATAVLSVLSSGYVKIGNLTGSVVRTTDNNAAPANTRVVPSTNNNYDATPRIQTTVMQPAASVGPASPLDFASMFSTYQQRSSDLGACGNTVTLTDVNGVPLNPPFPPGVDAFVHLTPGVTNVLDITAAQFNNIGILTFANQPSASTPLLINVDTSATGGVLDWHSPTFAGISGPQASFILINFPNATSIARTAGDEVEGTVFAPSASFAEVAGSNLEGNIVVDSYAQGSPTATGAEVHDRPFSTTLECGQPRATPTIDTAPSPAGGGPVGTAISDTATVSGGASPTGTVTFELFPPAEAACTGSPAFTSTIPLTGGSANSGPFVTTEAGTYRWIATYDGDANNNPVSSGCQAEPVPIGLATPTIASDPSAGGPLGVAIFDTATVSGGFNPTGTITFRLFAPGDITCTGTPVFTSTNPLLARSTSSGLFTPAAPGTYHWTATYNGDADNAPVSTACADEPVVIGAPEPAVITTVPFAGGPVGTSISDHATVSGGFNPTGTVTFALFPPGNATCTGTPVFTSTNPLIGGGATSGTFATTQAGDYRWIATYNGDANNPAVSSDCEDEPVTITRATPAIATAPMPPGGGVVGTSISDHAAVSGGFNPTGTVTFQLFPPGDTCGGSPVFVSTNPLIAGSATSGSFMTAEVGTYRWLATYGGDANNNPVSSGCQDEPVTTAKATPAITTAPSGGGPVGTSISDTATVSGGSNPTGTVTFRLFPPGDVACTGNPIFTSTGPLASGSATSEPFQTTAAGNYLWFATYNGDPNNVTVTSGCQEEPVTIARARPVMVTTPSGGGTVGAGISDTALLTGGFRVTGTVSFALFGPGDSQCANDLVANDATFHDLPLSGSTAASPNFTTTAVGTYQWVATYGGDADNDAAGGRCGDPAEQVATTALPAPPPTGSGPPPASPTAADLTPLGVLLLLLGRCRCYQRPRWTTSSKGRRLTRFRGFSGRSAG